MILLISSMIFLKNGFCGIREAVAIARAHARGALAACVRLVQFEQQFVLRTEWREKRRSEAFAQMVRLCRPQRAPRIVRRRKSHVIENAVDTEPRSLARSLHARYILWRLSIIGSNKEVRNLSESRRWCGPVPPRIWSVDEKGAVVVDGAIGVECDAGIHVACDKVVVGEEIGKPSFDLRPCFRYHLVTRALEGWSLAHVQAGGGPVADCDGQDPLNRPIAVFRQIEAGTELSLRHTGKSPGAVEEADVAIHDRHVAAKEVLHTNHPCCLQFVDIGEAWSKTFDVFIENDRHLLSGKGGYVDVSRNNLLVTSVVHKKRSRQLSCRMVHLQLDKSSSGHKLHPEFGQMARPGVDPHITGGSIKHVENTLLSRNHSARHKILSQVANHMSAATAWVRSENVARNHLDNVAVMCRVVFRAHKVPPRYIFKFVETALHR
eukprot:Opistho-2@78107